MNVLIDASSLMKELTGIGVYVRELLDHMIPLDSSINYTVFLNALKGQTPRFAWDQLPNVRVVRRRFPGKVLLELWRHNSLPTIEKLAGVKPDLFHSPNFYYQTSRATKKVATVHDLAFMKRSGYGGRYSGQYHRETLLKNLDEIHHFTVVSASVKLDLMEICQIPSDRISVIHHGMNPVFRPGAVTDSGSSTRNIIGYPNRYILSVGTIEPRKNLPHLVQAFDRFADRSPDMHLVIAGRFADGIGELEQAVERSSHSDRISLHGYVSFDTLLKLYQGAAATVFPSWDEGFGFPPLEAAACGVPVLASDIPVHREILGDTAWFFQPDSVDALVEEMTRCFNDDKGRQQRLQTGLNRARMFSWKSAAQRHIDLYRSIA